MEENTTGKSINQQIIERIETEFNNLKSQDIERLNLSNLVDLENAILRAEEIIELSLKYGS